MQFQDRFGPLPEMVGNLFLQMRVKLRAERAGLASVSWEGGQILLKYPAPVLDGEVKRMPDLGNGVRGGKGAYWVTFSKDEFWQSKILDVLLQLIEG